MENFWGWWIIPSYKSTGYTPVKNYFWLWILAEIEQLLCYLNCAQRSLREKHLGLLVNKLVSTINYTCQTYISATITADPYDSNVVKEKNKSTVHKIICANRMFEQQMTFCEDYWKTQEVHRVATVLWIIGRQKMMQAFVQVHTACRKDPNQRNPSSLILWYRVLYSQIALLI